MSEKILNDFVDILGYEGYYKINIDGEIYSCKSKRIIKSHLSKKGYLSIQLFKEGNQKCFRIHRLLATTFIPNPENKPQVNHINGIKTDNRLENLEWATAKENTIHSWSLGLSKSKEGHMKKMCNGNKKKCYIKDMTTNIVECYNSLVDLCDKYGFNDTAMSTAIRRKNLVFGRYMLSRSETFILKPSNPYKTDNNENAG